MSNLVIFLIAILIILLIGEKVRNHSIDNIKVSRELSKTGMFKNESMKLIMNIENPTKIPIPFVHIEEQFEANVIKVSSVEGKSMGNFNYYSTNLSINALERVKRTYEITADMRGVYSIRNLNLTIGDLFGINESTREIEEFNEFLVYPEIKSLKELSMANNSLLGNTLVKRWINDDPLITKGLREYTTNDRMKDIHWNSSLKMNNLMVREYDFTSDLDAIFILNVQCNDLFWSSIDGNIIEKGICIMTSLATQTMEQGIAVEAWTNAIIKSYKGNFKNEISCSKGQLGRILEFGARIDYTPSISFEDYLKIKIRKFRNNSVYVILTPYTNKEIEEVLIRLTKRGHIIKLIDLSKDNSIDIPYVEKINYRWEERYEQ